MELKDKIKTALDETRMLILGGGILLGFQFRGVFQSAYDDLPAPVRAADGAALALMLVMTALILTPSAYQRIVLGGTNTATFKTLAGRFAEAALLPFALALGIDLFISIGRVFGMAGGLAAGLGFAALALAGWYGMGEVARRKGIGAMQRQMAAAEAGKVEDTPLHTRIEQMLTEARVVLPGVQALFGFQLTIVLTEAFGRLPASSKLLHALSLGCVAVCVVLLMAPAAYHRIVYAGEDAEDFLHLGGMLVLAATVPLALGLAGDTYVVFAKIFDSAAVGVAAALVTLLVLIGFWHAFPLAAKARQAEGRQPGCAKAS